MDFEQAIRERAFSIWLESNREDGKADMHWLAAESEILLASMEAAARVMAESDAVRDEHALTKSIPKRATSKAGRTNYGRVRELSASRKNVRHRRQDDLSSSARNIVSRTGHANIP